ncbi:MAG: hypothetical protein RR436_06015 [Clostridia bacterium]
MKDLKEIITAKDIIKMLPYIGGVIATFYLLPLLNLINSNLNVVLLNIIPLICLAIGTVYAIREKHIWIFAGVSSLLYIPSIFIFYDWHSYVYFIGYTLIFVIGSLLGLLIKKFLKQK